MPGGRLGNLVLTLVVVVAVVAAYFALQPSAATASRGGARSNQPSYTNPVRVDTGSVISTVSAVGNIVPNQQSNLTFQTSGVVRAINVQQGQQVKAGQTLATLDDTTQQAAVKQAQLNLQAAQSALNVVLQPVDPNTLTIAEAAVKQAEGSYQSKASSGSTPADVAAAQTKLQQAQADAAYAGQIRAGVGGQVATTDPAYQLAQAQEGQATFNVAVAQLNLQQVQHSGGSLLSAQANIAYVQAKLQQTKAGPAQSAIDQAQANIVAAQTQLDQAQHALAQTVLVAPYAGVVSQINIKVGEPAQGAGAASTAATSSTSTSSTTSSTSSTSTTTSSSPNAAMVITDLSNLYANVNVDEGDIPRILPGQKLTLTVDALPGAQLTGKVDRVYPIADATASVISYPVHVILDTSSPQVAQSLRAGMTINATFVVQQIDNVVRVPNNYLRLNAATGQSTVNLVAPDGLTTLTVPVKLGVAGSDYTEVIQGLTPGDTIALAATTTGQGGQAGGQGGGQAGPQG